jgi:hypothetical protein
LLIISQFSTPSPAMDLSCLENIYRTVILVFFPLSLENWLKVMRDAAIRPSKSLTVDFISSI